MDPAEVYEELIASDEWEHFQKEVLGVLSQDEKEKYITMFNELPIENDHIGDVLFGDDGDEDADGFKHLYENLREEEKQILVDALYDAGFLNEDFDNGDGAAGGTY